MQIKKTFFNLYTLITIGLLLITASINAQNCVLEVNQVDPITGVVVKRTEDLTVGRLNGQPLYFKAQCIGERKYLKMRYFRYGNFTVSDKLPIIFTFSDNSTLQLMPRPLPESQQGSSTITSVSSMLIYDISPEQYNIIKKLPITSIAIKTEKGDDIDTDIRERFRYVIQNILNCVDINN